MCSAKGVVAFDRYGVLLFGSMSRGRNDQIYLPAAISTSVRPMPSAGVTAAGGCDAGRLAVMARSTTRLLGRVSGD